MDIEKEHIEEFLTKSCPSFVNTTGFREWREESADAEPLYYSLAGYFVRHLTSLNALKQYDEFPGVFAMIEELHLRGDRYVCCWATVGILEDVQNGNLHPPGSEPDDFIRHLQPVSKWWWDELNLFWNREMKPPLGSSGRPHPPNMGNSAQHLVTR